MSNPLRYKTRIHADLENENGSKTNLKFHVVSPSKLTAVELKFNWNEDTEDTATAGPTLVAVIPSTSVAVTPSTSAINNNSLPQSSSQNPPSSNSVTRIFSASKQARKKPGETSQAMINIDLSENEENAWKIVVQTPARKRIEIVISPGEKIDILKKILQRKLGIAQKDQLLHFMSHSIDDQKTISEIRFIQNGSTFILDNKEACNIPITIRTACGLTMHMHVKQNDDVKMLKTRVHDLKGICPRLQRLIYAGKDMRDEESLSKYNIRFGCCMHLVLRMVPLCASCLPSSEIASN